MEGDSPINRIEELPIIPITLMSLNLFFFAYALIFPQWTPYVVVCVALPVFLMAASSYGMTMASLYVVVFLIVIIGLTGIALTFLKLYKYGSLIFLICGLLTLPLGILGIIASSLVWQHSTVPRCIICKSSLKVDQSRPGYFYCTSCNASYAYVGRSRNL